LTRTLLIDADLLAYRATAAHQRKYDWDGTGDLSLAADFKKARDTAEETVDELGDLLKSDNVVVCLSDDFNSFRKDRVASDYKEFRTTTERPKYLYDLKDHLAETFETERWTTLEADDVMGIIATDPTRGDERVIVSADKDMMGVPAKVYRPPLTDEQREAAKGKAPVILDIEPIEAMRFHLWQTVVGDPVDGYLGARGVGPQSMYARDILEAQSEPEAWEAVLEAYAFVGSTEEHAVQQARLARILQYPDWDGRTPRLWVPPAYPAGSF